MHLVPEFDPLFYKNAHPDLASLDAENLRRHYETFGRDEGRTANQLRTRADFVKQISAGTSVLEIGPFASPVLVRPEVRYCDVLDQRQLRERAQALGLDANRVPFMHYVLDERGLDAITDSFETVVSSHSIEHQPDLITHLQQVGRRLRTPGRYFVLVPDKRYCFDRLIAPSTIAEVLDAHEQRRKVHTLRSVIEHRALTTHNQPDRHWSEPELRLCVNASVVGAAIEEWRAAQGGYLDVHAWYFTPESFSEIVRLLRELAFSPFDLERLYPTRRGSNEFWAVLVC
jgi:SAM-dependent methyltransferase